MFRLSLRTWMIAVTLVCLCSWAIGPPPKVYNPNQSQYYVFLYPRIVFREIIVIYRHRDQYAIAGYTDTRIYPYAISWSDTRTFIQWPIRYDGVCAVDLVPDLVPILVTAVTFFGLTLVLIIFDKPFHRHT